MPDDLWFDDPQVRETLMDAGLAVAVLDADGQMTLANPRFSAALDGASLASEQIRNLLAQTTPVRAMLRPATGDGAGIEALVLPIGRRALLIHGAADQEIESLRVRLEELERISTTDRLTGAWNRMHMERVVEAEVARAERHQQAVSLILLDIDHFKRINDDHGHAAGDDVLRELVARLNQGLRLTDSLYRWGGEEFLVLAADTGFEGARILAERLRAGIADAPFPGVGSVSISLGVAEFLPGESRELWFERADQFLYRAKGAGRNRVMVDARGAADLREHDHSRSPFELVWKPSYASGHRQIDEEHQQLFVLANQAMAEAIAVPKRDRQRFIQAIVSLVEHVEAHFAHEEAILEACGFRGLKGHRKAHQYLLKRAREVEQASLKGPVPLGTLVEFLAQEVILQHILGADQKFFALVAAHDRG